MVNYLLVPPCSLITPPCRAWRERGAEIGPKKTNNPTDIKFVAFRLQKLGYNPGVMALALGKWDTLIQTAIINFQSDHFNFKPDGVISPNNSTINKLTELSKQQKPTNEESQTATKLIEKYENNIDGLGKYLAGIARQNSILVKETIKEIGWLSADNLSVVISENLSSLNGIDKSLLEAMYNEIWDIGIGATYLAWLVNPAIGVSLSASTIEDFKQLKRLKEVLNAKIQNIEKKTEKNTTKDWDSDKCFNDVFLPTLFKHEGGYQSVASDSGNYVDGKLIGTNHGISAPVLKTHLKRSITVSDMKNLSKAEASKIYKTLYWTKPKVAEINDKYVAMQYADMYVNGGGASVKIMQKALNSLGFNVAVDGGIGPETLTAINNAEPKKLHEAYKKERIKFYENLFKKNPEKYGEWINGWKKRANSFNYGEE